MDSKHGEKEYLGPNQNLLDLSHPFFLFGQNYEGFVYNKPKGRIEKYGTFRYVCRYRYLSSYCRRDVFSWHFATF